jgi:hypothetical protein
MVAAVTDLFVVRSEPIPVEEIRPGMILILPSQRRVTVERVDVYDDGLHVVRWYRRAERGEPGFDNGHGDTVNDERDGRYLGSCTAVPKGHRWTVER